MWAQEKRLLVVRGDEIDRKESVCVCVSFLLCMQHLRFSEVLLWLGLVVIT